MLFACLTCGSNCGGPVCARALGAVYDPHPRLSVVAHKRWGVVPKIRIEATDRVGLERLLRYCARPIFAGERLAWVEAGERLVYYLPKPRANG
jgi:hypothetical protein